MLSYNKYEVRGLAVSIQPQTARSAGYARLEGVTGFLAYAMYDDVFCKRHCRRPARQIADIALDISRRAGMPSRRSTHCRHGSFLQKNAISLRGVILISFPGCRRLFIAGHKSAGTLHVG